MAYSFARVSSAVAMQIEDYFGQGKRWWVRLHEKGGEVHEMPCHHNLDAYLHAAGIAEAKKTPLFRSARGRTGELTGAPADFVWATNESPPRFRAMFFRKKTSGGRANPQIVENRREDGAVCQQVMSASISRLGRQSRQRLSTDIPP
jgi:hypothetical protein